MQNLSAVSRTVCEQVGGPEHLRDAGLHPLERERGRRPKNTLIPHTCYLTKFRRCRSYVGESPPPKMGMLKPRPLGMGVSDSVETCFTSFALRCQIRSF